MIRFDKEMSRERLITKGGNMLVPLRGSLSQCVLRYRAFLQALASVNSLKQKLSTTTATNEEKEEIKLKNQHLKNTKNILIRELKLHDLEMRKVFLNSKAGTAELDHYEVVANDTRESITQIRQEIDQFKEKLTFEQKVRKNRVEYEGLAKKAINRSSAYVTKRKLHQVRSDIVDLEMKKHKTVEKVEVRRKQFQGLIQNIFDLKNSLEEDTAKQNIEGKQNDDMLSKEIQQVEDIGNETDFYDDL